jgi:hypothetical protein
MYILNPWYEVSTSFLGWLFFHKWVVRFRFATEEETSTVRYAVTHYRNRGYFRTKEQAEAHKAKLDANPEWFPAW